MTLQCAPCLSDLALVRDSVTTIGGTATCTAHAVLMRYPSDDPGRRRKRLADLRNLAEARVVDATGLEKEKLELLAQEYAVAEAMDLGAPDRTGPGRGSERGRRGRDRDRRPGEPRDGHREPREPREGREGRPPREPRPDRGPRPEGGAPQGESDASPAASAPESESASADVGTPAPAPDVIAAEGGIPAGSDRPTGVPSTPAPAAQSEPSSAPASGEAPSASPAPMGEGAAAPSQELAAPAPAAPAGETAAATPAPAAPAGSAPSTETASTPQTSRDDSAFGTPETS